MKYQIFGEIFQLIKYIVTYQQLIDVAEENLENEEGEEIPQPEPQEPVTETFNLISDEELEELKTNLDEQGIEYTVETVDNVGYEWLNGKSFTNAERKKGYIKKAIELGETPYYEWLLLNDNDTQKDRRIATLESNSAVDKYEVEGEIAELKFALAAGGLI